MTSRLPRWIEYGAFILAFIAGSVNAIGLLGFEHQSVSHVSGTATLFGAGITHTSINTSLHLAGILLSFLIGAGLSGFLLSGTRLKMGRHYDTVLFIESIFIFISLYLLENESFYGHFSASAACGLQNALATAYSSAVIRTTHLTGIFTDFGIMLGAALKGEALDKRKGALFLLIILGFILGGTFGAYAFNAYHFYGLVFPGVACLFLAIGYRIYAHRTHSLK